MAPICLLTDTYLTIDSYSITYFNAYLTTYLPVDRWRQCENVLQMSLPF